MSAAGDLHFRVASEIGRLEWLYATNEELSGVFSALRIAMTELPSQEGDWTLRRIAGALSVVEPVTPVPSGEASDVG